MSSLFTLRIIAIGKEFYSGDAEQIIIPTIGGYHGILAQHEPMVTAMEPGELRFFTGGEWHYAAVSGGIVEVLPKIVTILADTVEHPDDIDLMRAEHDKEVAEDLLLQKKSRREHYQAQLTLSKAMARLSVASKHK